MPFLQLILTIGAADPAPFEEALLAAGASSITLEDAEDSPVLEPAPGTTPLWPKVRLKALFEAPVEREAILLSLHRDLPHPLPDIHAETIEDRAWEREWLKDFKPMRFGRRLWVCPDNQAPALESSAADRDALVLVQLDPGLAFGTGTHTTTALCLEWLDAADLRDLCIVDFGCGSGILAIAALKLGAREAIAVDIDEQALHATRENARRNGVETRLRTFASDQLDARGADLLLANILAEPLISLAPRFASMLQPRARIVLSGILASQAAAVAGHYAPWFDIGPETVREDWARLDGVRAAR